MVKNKVKTVRAAQVIENDPLDKVTSTEPWVPIKDDIPEGYIKLQVDGVFYGKREMVITGVPFRGDHNCDEMGCSSIGHVIVRYPLNLTKVVCVFCVKEFYFCPDVDVSYELCCPHCQEIMIVDIRMV